MTSEQDLTGQNLSTTKKLVDTFGRRVNYLRLSVTDRCDFRCTYCMAEQMQFLPRSEVLSLEELTTIATSFNQLGVDKIRITGGEPLIRKDIVHLFNNLGRLGLRDLSVTTNGSHLKQYAKALMTAGVHRINISLDSLKDQRFKALTRHGDLRQVLDGIQSAKMAGFQRIKINAVLLRNFNMDEALDLTKYCLHNGLDISFIEEMPLGEITSHARNIEFVASADIRAQLQETLELTATQESTGGPSRYWRVPGYPSRIGFISPHSDNFCGDCNRVRVSAEGRLLLCLGNEHSMDLKAILRDTALTNTEKELANQIVKAMTIKPEKHHFNTNEAPQILRFMNATGG